MNDGVPRAVHDTNVLVAAFITPTGASARLLIELPAGAFELVVSPMLLAELDEVLRRPRFRRYASEAEVDAHVSLIRLEGIVYDDPEPSAQPLGVDPDDEYVIDLARAARFDALVSGDAHFHDLRGIVPVMSPAEFLGSL